MPHGEVRERFLAAMRRGRLHHAWLLHGPSGVGKAELGRMLARDFLCERNRADADAAAPACGQCHACRLMDAGSHPDFLLVEREWDAKNKRHKRDVGVARVRELLDFLSLRGAESERRAALLSEAELMNAQAANALLKGLEEPGAGSLLILACADVTRLPATIRSRCLLAPVRPLDDDACMAALREAGITEEMLPFAARLAVGRPGRVMPLLEADVAGALREWDELTRDLGRGDVGRIHAWIAAHARQMPRDLVVETVLVNVRPAMETAGGDVRAMDALMDAAWRLAAWPELARRQTLNPVSSLLAHVLELRVALRAASQQPARA